MLKITFIKYPQWGLIISLLFISACSERPNTLEQVLQSGELLVATRNSPSTYYEGPQGPAGFEYELASLFAQSLGVKLKLVVPEQFNDLIPLVTHREVHLAAAGITHTIARQKQIHFTSPYQSVTQQLIYRTGTRLPHTLEDISPDSRFEVISGSTHAEQLKSLAQLYPTLPWTEVDQYNSEALLSRVWNKDIQYTIANSNDFIMNQHNYPELRVAFDLSEPQNLAWAFPRGHDESLYEKAQTFFQTVKENGQLQQLYERYYGHIQNFDYVGTRTFMRHIDSRLTRYKDYFKTAAKKTDQDWRLLAAIGYQESHWNARAISATGVRGIMMLTRSTALDMGYRNRIKPYNSIMGGARYLKKIKKRLPAHIEEPDRTWFALAAYNIGPGHLEDARRLTRKYGKNADRWLDVKEILPLLTDKHWYQQTRYGYARGHEALQYVQNIRSYNDLLIRHTTKNKQIASLTTHHSFKMTQHTLPSSAL